MHLNLRENALWGLHTNKQTSMMRTHLLNSYLSALGYLSIFRISHHLPSEDCHSKQPIVIPPNEHRQP